MLVVTPLGHQGWLLGSGRTHILVDPLLSDVFGMRAEAGFRVFPPRKLDLRHCPPIDAVWITHEHDDHFQIPSLDRIDRRIPLFMTDRISEAARRAAAAMGFQVRLIGADASVQFPDLLLQTFAPDLVDGQCADEWDVLPFLVSTSVPGESFFSCVDLPIPASTLRSLGTDHFPALVAIANNHVSRHCLTNWQPAPSGSRPVVKELSERVDDPALSGWPRAWLLTGGGWSFTGSKEWLNRCFFPADNEAVAAGLQQSGLSRRSEVLACLPGRSILLDGARLTIDQCLHSRFLALPAREQWPTRSFDVETPRARDVPCLFAGQPFADDELPNLRQRLERLGRSMVGSAIFLALNSLTAAELQGRRRAYTLFAQTSDNGEGYRFEYDAASSSFRPAESKIDSYAAGGVCWAQDLHALLRGELSAAGFDMGHLFEWHSIRPRRPQPLSLCWPLWKACHPLSMPDDLLRAYQGLVATTCYDGPRVRPH